MAHPRKAYIVYDILEKKSARTKGFYWKFKNSQRKNHFSVDLLESLENAKLPIRKKSNKNPLNKKIS